MSIQEHTWGDGPTPSWLEAWPGWAGMPASVEYGALEAEAPPAPTEDPLSAAVRELKECLEHYITHRHEVIVRRTQYDLDKAAARIRATDYPDAENYAANHVLKPPPEAAMLEAFTKASMKTLATR